MHISDSVYVYTIVCGKRSNGSILTPTRYLVFVDDKSCRTQNSEGFFSNVTFGGTSRHREKHSPAYVLHTIFTVFRPAVENPDVNSNRTPYLYGIDFLVGGRFSPNSHTKFVIVSSSFRVLYKVATHAYAMVIGQATNRKHIDRCP